MKQEYKKYIFLAITGVLALLILGISIRLSQRKSVSPTILKAVSPQCQDTITLVQPGKPDLTMSGTFTVTPQNKVVGQPINVKFTIINQGQASGPMTYRYTNQADVVDSNIGAGNTCYGNIVLAPGESCVSSYDFIFPSAGSKTMTIGIDVENNVDESNETNNTFSITFTVGSVATATPTPTPSPTPTPAKAGDVSGDGQVNMVDIGIVVDAYRTNPISDTRADLNGDGTVNSIDIGIVVNNFGL
jgi:hypothetical protein